MDTAVGAEQAAPLRSDVDSVVLLRAVEVARLLGISRSQVYAMMASGQLPVIRIGRAIRVPKRALADWVTSNTVGVAAR